MWLFTARPYQASATDEQFVPEIEGSSTNTKTEGKCQTKNCRINQTKIRTKLIVRFPVSNRYETK